MPHYYTPLQQLTDRQTALYLETKLDQLDTAIWNIQSGVVPVSIPASSLLPGTVPAGVLVPVSSLLPGTVPAGVLVPAANVLPGGFPAGDYGFAAGSRLGIGTSAPSQLLHITAAAATPSLIAFAITTTPYGYYGIAGAANSLIGGSALGDTAIRSQGGKILLSTNSGTAAQLSVDAAGKTTVEPISGMTVAALLIRDTQAAASGPNIQMNDSTNSKSMFIRFNNGTMEWVNNTYTAVIMSLTNAGALTKTSGTFRIPHPDPAKTDTHQLQHSFVESPTRGDNLYRFAVHAKHRGERLLVPLPAYYRWLNENDQAWCTNGAEGAVNAEQTAVAICAARPGPINVLVIGTRKDPHAQDAWNRLGVEFPNGDQSLEES